MTVNINDGGTAPMFSSQELRQMGFQIAIWPSFLPLAIIHTLRHAISVFQQTGSSKNPAVPLASFAEFSDLIGFDRVREFARRWQES